MPLYEYRCVEDGEVIELLRSMREADAPVEDPEGRGRTFERIHSAFRVGEGVTTAASTRPGMGGGCACGHPHGPCAG